MKDIPIFTGQFGVATLILREIPYKRCAYVMVRSARPGKLPQLLEECGQFCVMAGAERVLATADGPLDFLPHVHDLLELSCARKRLRPPEPPVALTPVTAENGGLFLEAYNLLFRELPNAATYTHTDLERILRTGRAYLAHVDGDLAGFGEISGPELCAIGVLPAHRGLGQRLALTLFAGMPVERVTLRVSSANGPALRLYEKLGFGRGRVLSRWHALKGE